MRDSVDEPAKNMKMIAAILSGIVLGVSGVQGARYVSGDTEFNDRVCRERVSSLETRMANSEQNTKEMFRVIMEYVKEIREELREMRKVNR